MAWKYNVHVSGVEIELNRVRTGAELTERCGLSALVNMIGADATKWRTSGTM